MSEEDKVPSPDGVGVVPEPEPETVRRRPKWLAPAAVGCVLVLLAVGGVVGCRMWSARELACFASMFVRQVRQCFSVVWADGFPRCRHRFPVM